MSQWTTCPACQRHIRQTDATCPFCQSKPSGLLRWGLAVGSAAIALACGRDAENPSPPVNVDQPDGPVATPSASASSASGSTEPPKPPPNDDPGEVKPPPKKPLIDRPRPVARYGIPRRPVKPKNP